MTDEQIRGWRLWYDLCKNGKDIVEIRLIEIGTGKTYSGYFDNIDTIIEALKPYEATCNCYWVLNAINPACFARAQHNKFVAKPRETTSDKDVVGYDWIFIDVDVERPSGVMSTDEELAYAKNKANEIYKYLRSSNITSCIVAVSGSGVHILVRVNLKNTPERHKLVKDFLDALGMMFSDERVHIDGAVANAARLCRAYFWPNRKGESTEIRPHRMAYIVKYNDDMTPTDPAYLEKIAALIPTPETPSRENHYRGADSFNLEEFFEKYNIQIAKKVILPAYTKYILAECPWEPSHKAPDSCVLSFNGGGYQFICLHQSHRHFTFRDFRLKYEPSAYDKKTYSEYVHKRNYYGMYQRPEFQPQEETEAKGPKWKKLGSVKKSQISINDYVVSGFPALDSVMCGFRRGHLSLWSGLRGSAKSTILNMCILNAANRGYKTALWTAELDDSEVKTWLYLQAAGKTFNKPSSFNSFFYTPKPVVEKIDPWIDQYVSLYEQAYGDNYLQLENDIRELHAKDPHDVYIADNIMCMDLSDLDGDKYDKQKEMVKRLVRLAKELKCCIHLVGHPNKSLGFLRPNSISGSGNMPDLAQNIFICHRVNTDFERSAADFLPKSTLDDILSSGCTNVIEICKCRDKGSAVGTFVKLWFEIESNRLKSDPYEVINYNWQEQTAQTSINDLPSYEIDTPFSNPDPFGAPVSDEQVPF